MSENKVQVNQVSYPHREVFERYLDRLYDGQDYKENGWLQLELESRLRDYLGSKHVFFASNGTMALLVSLLSLEVKGDVILSAFGHPATVDAVVAAGCKPKFCDIDPIHFCLDAEKLKTVIDQDTVAILATQIYGNACDHDELFSISRETGIPLMYDSSHAFGSVWNDKPLVTYGDISAVSLQAFKVFSALEGGLIITDNNELAERVYRYRFFGKDRTNNFVGFGLNGKGSDLHAAVALTNLENLGETIERRKSNFLRYRTGLKVGKDFVVYEFRPGLVPNYAYLPLVFKDPNKTNVAINQLRKVGVVARRYFNPTLNKLPFITSSTSCPVSEDLSERVICVPVHHKVTENDIDRIVSILNAC